MVRMIIIYPHVSGYAIYYLLATKGSWSEVLRQGVTPVIKPRVEALLVEEKACLTFSDVEMNIVDDIADASDDSKHWLHEDL